MPLKYTTCIFLQLAWLFYSINSIAQTPCEINFNLLSDSLLISDDLACIPLTIEGSDELSEFALSFTFNNSHLDYRNFVIVKSDLDTIGVQHSEQGDETILQIEWSSAVGLAFQDGEVLFEICLDVQTQKFFDSRIKNHLNLY